MVDGRGRPSIEMMGSVVEELKSLKIVIVGTAHCIQHVTWDCAAEIEPQVVEGRSRFRRAVECFVREYGIERIAEEAKHGRATIAQSFTPCWENISGAPWHDSCIGEPEEIKEAAKSRFESEMCAKASDFLEGAVSGLLIVGASHLDAIAAFFVLAGAEVIPIDQRQSAWWHPVFESPPRGASGASGG
jgi:hypothetical protein